MKFAFLFFVVFFLIAGRFAWRYIRSGSLIGALLGGRIKRELGAVEIESGKLTSQNLKVFAMENLDEASLSGFR